MATLVKSLWNGAFKKYLVVTNTVTCSVMFATGDLLSQIIIKKDFKKVDLHQTARFAIYGCMVGPLNHWWYLKLDRLLPRLDKASIIRKIFLDQTIAGPFFITAFFMGLGTIEKRSMTENLRTTSENFWPVYKADLAVWPLAQLINFSLVPTYLRVTYIAFVTFCWNTFLAYYRNRFAYQEIQPRKTCETNILRISNISRQAQAGHTSGTNSYPLDRLNIFSFSDTVEMDMFLRTEKREEIPCYKAIDFRGVQSVTAVEDMQSTCTSTLLKCVAAGQYFQPKFSFLQTSYSIDNRTAEATSQKLKSSHRHHNRACDTISLRIRSIMGRSRH